MPHPYLGNAPRQYPQYRDLATDRPLEPQPGGAYSMAPVAGNGDLPVPPGDGRWGPEADALNRALTALDAFASAGSEDEAMAALNAVADAAVEAQAALGTADVSEPGAPPRPAAKTRRKAAPAADKGA